jgi:hypothetical protein
MDLFNNVIGAGIGSVLKGANEKVIVDSILKAISKGSMRIILKDKLGRSCDADYKPIPVERMHGKWVTPRVLVPSDNLLMIK